MKMTPAEYCVHVFGGVRPLARFMGLNPSTVCRWRKPKAQGGTDGVIPSAQQRALLDLAEHYKLDLRPEDLVVGRQVGA